MPPATFDFGGKVVLVTGVGRAGQIGNAVALAFGTGRRQDRRLRPERGGRRRAGARVRRAGRRRPALRGRPHPARTSRRSRWRWRSGTSAGWTWWSTWRAGSPRTGRSSSSPCRISTARSSINLKTTVLVSQAAIRCARRRREGASSTSRRSPTSSRRARWRSTRRPRPPWPASPGAWRWSWRTGRSGSTRSRPGMARTGDNVAAAGAGGRVRRDGGAHRRRAGAGRRRARRADRRRSVRSLRASASRG